MTRCYKTCFSLKCTLILMQNYKLCYESDRNVPIFNEGESIVNLQLKKWSKDLAINLIQQGVTVLYCLQINVLLIVLKTSLCSRSAGLGLVEWQLLSISFLLLDLLQYALLFLNIKSIRCLLYYRVFSVFFSCDCIKITGNVQEQNLVRK